MAQGRDQTRYGTGEASYATDTGSEVTRGRPKQTYTRTHAHTMKCHDCDDIVRHHIMLRPAVDGNTAIISRLPFPPDRRPAGHFDR